MEENQMQSRTNKLTLRVLAAGLLIMALAIMLGCSTESDDIPTGPAVTVDRLIEMGWTYLNAGETNDALFTFQEAANAQASNLEAYLGLGYAYAQSQEPTNAQRNLGTVLSQGEVLLANGDLDPLVADTLFAEACAGRASVALSTQDYDMAIEEAQNALMYWADFAAPEHRWLEAYSLEMVMEVETRAWLGLEEYGEVMLLLDELSNGEFIKQLKGEGIIVLVGYDEDENGDPIPGAVPEDVTVTLLEETEQTGVAELELANINLIYPVSVAKGGVEYSIVSYDITGNVVQFMANPIPSPGDVYMIEYYHTPDFGEFLIALQDELN
jgi:tetratricopeptide (TPR) repeat protein